MSPHYLVVAGLVFVLAVLLLLRRNMKINQEKALEALNDALEHASELTFDVEKLKVTSRTIMAISFLWPNAHWLEQTIKRHRIQVRVQLFVPRVTTIIQALLESNNDSKRYEPNSDDAKSTAESCTALSAAKALFRYDKGRTVASGITVCFPISDITANKELDGGTELQLEAFGKPVGTLKATQLAA